MVESKQNSSLHVKFFLTITVSTTITQEQKNIYYKDFYLNHYDMSNGKKNHIKVFKCDNLIKQCFLTRPKIIYPFMSNLKSGNFNSSNLFFNDF